MTKAMAEGRGWDLYMPFNGPLKQVYESDIYIVPNLEDSVQT